MQASEYFNTSVQQLMKSYPEDEARQIMYWVYEDVLLIKRAHLQYLDKELGFAEELKLDAIKQRLLTGEPLQYVLGYAYFYNLVLKVNGHVLIPRPETEELVAWIKDENPGENALNILDIGTGSGCIALALKYALPHARVTAIDISPEALALAGHNANKLKLKVNFEELSVLSNNGQAWIMAQPFQLIVSNPPYIAEAEKESMHVNVIGYEPHLALFVPNDDPLVFYRNIIGIFALHKTASQLFLEISEHRQQQLAALCEQHQLAFTFKADMQGKPRMLRIKKDIML